LKKNILFILAVLFTCNLTAQSIGVRAGWSFNTFSGPLEGAEKYGLANGIHFGVNYGLKLTNNFMVRSELLYSQSGTKQTYDGDSYYLIYTSDKTLYEKGKRKLDLQISNSYVGIPVTAVGNFGKFEIFGGMGAYVLINPTARGTVRFESAAKPKDIIFKQALDYRYNSDEAKAAANQLYGSGELKIIVDNRIVVLPKSIGAYYQNDALFGKKFNWFNLTAIGGVNYFINRGFFIGGRIERGLLDVTNNRMDVSLESFNNDLSLKNRLDKDIQLTYQLSCGFKF
jgi:hypothetical protein